MNNYYCCKVLPSATFGVTMSISGSNGVKSYSCSFSSAQAISAPPFVYFSLMVIMNLVANGGGYIIARLTCGSYSIIDVILEFSLCLSLLHCTSRLQNTECGFFQQILRSKKWKQARKSGAAGTTTVLLA